jgi:hypothetical protein
LNTRQSAISLVEVVVHDSGFSDIILRIQIIAEMCLNEKDGRKEIVPDIATDTDRKLGRPGSAC